MPAKPLVIYDGDCSFCRRWIVRWRMLTGNRVEYAPAQEVHGRFSIPLKRFLETLHFADERGNMFTGAAAVFESLAKAPGHGWPLWIYRHVPGAAWVCETAYRWVASHRPWAGRLTNILWGQDISPGRYQLVRNIFLRVLGMVYVTAFLSLAVQIAGLVGRDGIWPADAFLEAAARQVGRAGYFYVPTLFWWNASDWALLWICWGGAALGLTAAAGYGRGLIFFLLWAFYLSLASVGGDFLSFQWDNLLLETGFLAMFWAPWTLRFRAPLPEAPSPLVLGLLRWLLFRLMMSSGLVKLLSGDPTWRDLTALQFHYETQPLPTWVGWWAHQLPAWFQTTSVAGLFAVELLVPFLVFSPRRTRRWAAGLFVTLQIVIALTGNYCFFNFLAAALCLPLLNDQWLESAFTRRKKEPMPEVPAGAVKKWVVRGFASVIFCLSLIQWRAQIFRSPGPSLFAPLMRWAGPWRSVNPYGLFAVMTTTRDEIVVEGSRDGRTWEAYEFKWKPGDLSRRPAFIAPHQPRLDWQMWFAALGTAQQNPWFLNFCARLLQGSPAVTGLLEKNPFAGAPPRFIRAVTYEYHFTDRDARSLSGDWWRRAPKGLYVHPMSLREG